MKEDMGLAAALVVIVVGIGYIMGNHPEFGLLGAVVGVGSLVAGWKVAATKGW